MKDKIINEKVLGEQCPRCSTGGTTSISIDMLCGVWCVVVSGDGVVVWAQNNSG